MAKITDTDIFPLATTLNDDALVYTVDGSTSTPLDKSIQLQNLIDHNKHFGQVYVQGASATQTVTADTWTKVTAFTANGLVNGCTADHSNDLITLGKTGLWLVMYSASLYSASVATVDLGIYLDSTIIAPTQSTQKVGAGYTLQTGSVGIVDVTSISGTADNISVYARSTHTAFIIGNASLTAIRLMNT